jgi:tRNA (cmo5U34)-methyltransferase
MFRIIRKSGLKGETVSGTTDKNFATPQPAHDFKFGSETASVFDDMVNRSVPYYNEIQRMVCELAGSFATQGTNLYDIGCATGTTLFHLSNLLDKDIQLIGMDNSNDMLEKAIHKFENLPGKDRIKLVNANLNELPEIENSSVVILLLTLQFVRPLHRGKLIRQIYNGLNNNGCLILVEKVTGSCTLLNRLFI